MLKFIVIVISKVIIEVIVIFIVTLSMGARRKRTWPAPWT